MKGSKKLLVLLVVLFATLGFVGCNQETSTEQQTTGQTTQTTQSTEAPADLAAALADLKTHYADTLESTTYVATDDLTLVATIGGADVTWTSGNTDVITNAGVVTRPTYTIGDQTVVLTATLSNGVDADVSYQFFVSVDALDKSDAERAADVFLVVTAFPAKEKWNEADSANLDFLTSGVDAEGVSYTVVWTSSDPTVISVDGNITQPEDADVVVTMTATITINDVDYTADVVFTVAKVEEAVDVNTIAEAIALGEGSFVNVQGVTVTQVTGDGNVFLTDGVDLLYVYSPSFDVVAGDVIDVTGEVAYHYFAPQLIGTTSHPLEAVASTEAASDAPVQTPATLGDLIDGLSVPSDAEPWEYTYYTVTARIYINEDWGNYSMFLVPLDYDFDAAIPDGQEQPNGDAIMMYYRSDIDVLSELHGKEVTLTILSQGYRTDKGVYYANYFGNGSDVTVADFLTDTEAVAAAKAAFTLPGEVIENTTLDLPASIFGVTVTYASDDPTRIDPTTGLVDLTGLETQVDVTVTATFTLNTAIDTKAIEVKVGELPLSTIADALVASGKVMIEGVVTISENDGGFMVQDSTGAIYVYTYNTETLDTILSENLGNVVTIIGTRGAYSGLEQIYVSEVSYKEDGTIPAPTNIDNLDLDETGLADLQAYRVTLTDMLVVSVSGTDNITIVLQRVSDGQTISIRFDEDNVLSTATQALLDGIAVGDKITITTGLSWYNAPQLVFVDNTEVTEGTPYTDAELLAADASRFEAAVTTTVDYVLPELIYTDSVAVAIAVELQPYLADDLAANDTLVVTLPNGDVTGNVTFTLTRGTETLDVVVALTLDGLTDAEKLSADQADLAIDTTAYAQQTIVLPLEGAVGSTIVWTVVSGTATLDVDGKTLTFADSAIDYNVELQATLSIGSETPVTKDFMVVVTGYVTITDFSTLYVQTVSGTYDVLDGVDMYFQGVVVDFGYGVAYLTDANGVGLKIDKYLVNTLSVGDEVIIMGQFEESNGVRQVTEDAMIIVILSEGNTFTPVSMTADEVIAINASNVGQLIEIADSVTLTETGTYYRFTVTGTTETIIISTHSSNLPEWFDDVYAVNDTLEPFSFIFSKFYVPSEGATQLQVEGITMVMTEQQMLDADAAALPESHDFTDDLLLDDGEYGSTYEVTGITGDAASYLSWNAATKTIEFTEPASDMNGAVTVLVTKGSLTTTETINVVAKASTVAPTPDLFISEYGEGSSSNKWIEIYNPTGAAVDLSAYSVKLNSNANQDWNNYVLQLSGTLAAGDVLVIVNGSVNSDVQLVIDNADITESGSYPNLVTIFNGDDAIGLFKNDVLIDLFGVFGEDPGSSWEVGTSDSTVDHTLVRNPDVTAPSILWDPSEWTAYDQNTDDYVGSHTVN